MILKLLLNTRMTWMINIEEYDCFHDRIADMLSNKILNPIVTELLIRGRKLNIYLVFIIQSYFAVPKNIRLNFTSCFILKTPNKFASTSCT